MYWIENDQIEKALIKKSTKSIEKTGLLYCISDDFEDAILLREHAAWEVQGKGWRDSNSAPDTNQEGRWVLNFYHYDREDESSSWFKMLVPKQYKITSIKSLGSQYVITTDKGAFQSSFSSLDDLMFDVMSGSPEPEEEIERNFLLLGKTD